MDEALWKLEPTVVTMLVVNSLNMERTVRLQNPKPSMNIYEATGIILLASSLHAGMCGMSLQFTVSSLAIG